MSETDPTASALPVLTPEQRDMLGAVILSELGFTDIIGKEVTVGEVQLVAGQFLRHEGCYQGALPLATAHMQLKQQAADANSTPEIRTAYADSRQALRKQIGGLLGMNIVESEA